MGKLGEAMKCGGCGGTTVKLFASRVGTDRHAWSEIKARCEGCRSVTTFSLPAPTIRPVGDDATMCIGWPKNG